MMTDPYKVLGVPSTATDEEVKQAYRRLAKRYHPDANPGDKEAERRMQEINAAYYEIINRKNTSSSGYYDPFGAYGSSGSRYSGDSGSDYFRATRNYIQAGRYREALNVLNSILERNAEWYYLSALANAGAGNRILARQHAEQAVNMQPQNMEYRSLYERLQNPGQTYTTYSRDYSAPNFCGGSNYCWSLCLLNLFCNMCCTWRMC